MNKYQTQHEKDKKSYAAFVKKVGAFPNFSGSRRTEKEKKIIKAYDKWANEGDKK
jgi:hypothetical protein